MEKQEGGVWAWLRKLTGHGLEQAAISGELTGRMQPLVEKVFADLKHLNDDELLREWPKDRPTGRIGAQEAVKMAEK